MTAHRHRSFKLSVKTELLAGQTLMSFVSACASLSGLRSTSRFCVAFGMDLAGLKGGRPETLARLSELTNISVARLLLAAHRGMPRHDLVGNAVDPVDICAQARICPHCLSDDHLAQPNLRMETAVHYRGAWSHALVHSCAVHNTLLVAMPDQEASSDPLEDFATAVRLVLAATGFPQTIARSATPVEIYIQKRLSAQATEVPLLDAMELNDGMFLCRYLGAPHRQAHRAVPAVGIEERLERTNQGFMIAADGPEAVRHRLLEIAQIVNPHGAAEIGLRRVFNDLYDRLHKRAGADNLAIRRLLVDIGVTQNLIAFEQTEVLGLAIPSRTRQAVSSASKRFGISDRELRAALIHLNVIKDDDTRSSDSLLFDVAPVTSLLSRLKVSLNLIETAQILGLHPEQTIRICDAGLLEPFFIRPSADLKPLRYFDRSEVKAFLSKLTVSCMRVSDASQLLDIWEAGLKACRRPVDIIAAIFDGRIRKTYRTGSSVDLRTLLVDLDDVHNCAFQESDELVSAEDCSRILTINITAMRIIMHSGILQSEMGTNPVNRRQQLSARQEVIRAFDGEFVSLNALSKMFDFSSTGLMQALHACGVKLAFPPEQSIVRIYKRAAVGAVQAKIEQIRGRHKKAARRVIIR